MSGNTSQSNPDYRLPSPKKGGETKIVFLSEKKMYVIFKIID